MIRTINYYIQINLLITIFGCINNDIIGIDVLHDLTECPQCIHFKVN